MLPKLTTSHWVITSYSSLTHGKQANRNDGVRIEADDAVATILSLFPSKAIEDMRNELVFRSPILWLNESIESNVYPHLALTSNITSNVSSQEKQLFFSIICKGV